VKAWVPVARGSPFPLANLPFGVFSPPKGEPRVGVAVGDHVVDLSALAGVGLIATPRRVLITPSLNAFMARGPDEWRRVRARLGELFCDPDARAAVMPAMHRLADVRLHLPIEVADYVDFYSSRQHAENAGRIMRPGAEPLSPNWLHLPVGYHGRAGTMVVSGTPVIRPCGQRLVSVGGDGPPRPSPPPRPEFGPSARLDFEAEVGFVVGVPTQRGERLSPADLADHVFGVVLLNDWSARDIQAWESAPLGPFLGKSFATSVSPWVVTLDALALARVPPVPQNPAPLEHLTDPDPWCLDLTLEVRLNGEVVSRPPFATMYWTPGQQLAHMTSNGTPLRTGDLFASGTVSGPAPEEWGSLLELTRNGAEPLALADGSRRAWLEDGDTISITASAPGRGRGTRIGLGEVTGTVLPALVAKAAR